MLKVLKKMRSIFLTASVNPDSQASVRVGRNTVVIRVIVDTRLKIVDLGLSSFPLIQSTHLES